MANHRVTNTTKPTDRVSVIGAGTRGDNGRTGKVFAFGSHVIPPAGKHDGTQVKR